MSTREGPRDGATPVVCNQDCLAPAAQSLDDAADIRDQLRQAVGADIFRLI